MGFNKISSKIYNDKCPLKTQEKILNILTLCIKKKKETKPKFVVRWK